MKKIHADYLLAGSLLASAAIVYAGIVFLDRKIALAVQHLLHFNPFLQDATRDIPDLLLQLVCVASLAMWIAYFYLVRRNERSVHVQFLKLAATSVPFSYILKSLLQTFFGRINTRVWLQNSTSTDIRWFTGLENNGGFPSGHMTVFTAFFVAVWFYYPAYRPISALALSALAMALILTNYHFMSDVIAGFYVGLLVTLVTRFCLNRTTAP